MSDERFREGLFGLEAGAETIVLTWLDRADEGASDVLLEASWIEPGDADGDREGGPG